MIKTDRPDAEFFEYLERKASWVRRETLRIHSIAPETRIASSLSDVEVFVALYYGGILNCDPANSQCESRDRFIVSKGHGGISLYPILAELGFFELAELSRVCQRGSFLGAIPDSLIPGVETTNGSLGHGLGVGCGIALALKRKGTAASVFVLVGDGELYEGAVWEAIMFAAHHRLSNLVLIVDNNRISMLDYCERTLKLTPLDDKFRTFGWQVASVDGHNLGELWDSLSGFKKERDNGPKVLIADTVKGKGVPVLEQNSLCHIRTLTMDEVAAAIGDVT